MSDSTRGRILEVYGGGVEKTISEFVFPVFVGGPSLNDAKSSAAKLRACFIEKLQAENFEVFTGEGDDVEEVRIKGEFDAQLNEVKFISECCRVIILVPDSPGSFCELGLFSWHYTEDSTRWFNRNKIDFWVFSDSCYKDQKSYFNEGPIAALRTANAKICYVNFDTYDVSQIIDVLTKRRATKAIHAS